MRAKFLQTLFSMAVLAGAASCSNGSELRPSSDFVRSYGGSNGFSTDERECLEKFPALRKLVADSKQIEGPNLDRSANLAAMTCFGHRFVVAVAEQGNAPTVRDCRKRVLLAELEIAIDAGGADFYAFGSSPALTAAVKKECSSVGNG
jgi:hypothetical protein